MELNIMTPDEVLQHKDQAVREIQDAGDLKELEAVRIKYLGRNGLVQEVMAALKNAVPADKPAFGKNANVFKKEIGASLDARKTELEGQAGSPSASFDWTLPGRWRAEGTRHPISLITEQAVAIFRTMGFTVAEGPDVETVSHNFDALNTPKDHPSRDPQDTFYLDAQDLVLRTHTSPVQIRYMKNHKPPVRIVAPGRAYRRDTPDATHSATFHQIEGLYVADRVSMADLKGDLAYFARKLMGPDVNVRFRPHFFPFTEPSVEVDFSCHVCSGKGCRVCKNSGWIEIAGAGLVDPEVFKAVDYDTTELTGYAFGMGIERIAMILYGIEDIRMLYDNDLRFLNQF